MKKNTPQSLIRTALLALLVVFILSIGFFFWADRGDGKTYSSKEALCIDFALSYLKTIAKTHNITDLSSETWEMAVDIETDLYNMCLLDLNTESIQEYHLDAKALEKYKE